MATETEKAVIKAFHEFVAAPEELQTLVQAFEAFVKAFGRLKAANESQQKQFATDFRGAFKEMQLAISKLKNGENGKTPRPGIDYPSRAQFAAMIEAIRPKTPEVGVDYFIPTGEEIAQIVADKYLTTSDIFKAIFSIPDNVIAAINEARTTINAERVDGLEKLVKEVFRKQWPPFYAAAGVAAATVASWKTPVETVDGSATVFTTSGQPGDVVADGITMFNGAGYTYAAGQITFTNPPQLYVRYR